jgi:hypothetical protein
MQSNRTRRVRDAQKDGWGIDVYCGEVTVADQGQVCFDFVEAFFSFFKPVFGQ